MTKITHFEDSFLVSGMMCFDECGETLQLMLNNCVIDCIKQGLLPENAKLTLYSEPMDVGVHRVFIVIDSEKSDFVLDDDMYKELSNTLRDEIPFEIIADPGQFAKKTNPVNLINIFINVLAIIAITTLSLIFPPALWLTLTLITISFAAATVTARAYLFSFIKNLRKGFLANMSTTISLGWLLSLTHTLIHTITMPLTASFSMVFMDFTMPVLLMAGINSMDEIKRRVHEKTQKMRLQGISTLFPQMAKTYLCHNLTEAQRIQLKEQIAALVTKPAIERPIAIPEEIQQLTMNEGTLTERHYLQEGMLFQVNAGECFPVDCILVNSTAVIDASLLTGEWQQHKKLWEDIPAGAINLDKTVTVYAQKNIFNSTVNRLLLRANRPREENTNKQQKPLFAYFYAAFIFLAFIAAIAAPLAFGLFSFAPILANVIGVIFSVCPCTLALAHKLPALMSLFQRHQQGVHLREESLTGQTEEAHTIIFDKTGTLTTGNSIVESATIPATSPLWQRIYLLEKNAGRGHPLAKAIVNYFETHIHANIIINTASDCAADHNNRGITGIIQGKRIHLGNEDYIRSVVTDMPATDQHLIAKGLSPVYVAEDGIFQGVIYVKHEIRRGVASALKRLKQQGKKIIMLTGDNAHSAHGFNRQLGSVFADCDIYSSQTPEDKEAFLKTLMESSQKSRAGFWFVGDGLNDAPCCRMVSELGGISCAMEKNDKAAFFADICLNGLLDYLFHHPQLNRFLRTTVRENQGVLAGSALALLAVIICFSAIGLAVPPLIPMGIMIASTLFVLFNAYRSQYLVNNTLLKKNAWNEKILASPLPMVMLGLASALFLCSLLAATLATGGLALPVLAFSAGGVLAFCSGGTLAGITLVAGFALILVGHLCSPNTDGSPTEESSAASQEVENKILPSTCKPLDSQKLPTISADNSNIPLGSVDNCSTTPTTTTCRGSSAASIDPADKPRDLGLSVKCQ